MRLMFFLLFATQLLLACKGKDTDLEPQAIPNDAQTALYTKITGALLQQTVKPTQDSIKFLVLPIDITCPSCRKKILESIDKHKDTEYTSRYIIIASNGGRRSIEGYFREYDLSLPAGSKNLILDTTGYMLRLNLFQKEPVLYEAVNGKVLTKTRVYPKSVKSILQSFYKV